MRVCRNSSEDCYQGDKPPFARLLAGQQGTSLCQTSERLLPLVEALAAEWSRRWQDLVAKGLLPLQSPAVAVTTEAAASMLRRLAAGDAQGLATDLQRRSEHLLAAGATLEEAFADGQMLVEAAASVLFLRDQG